METRHEKVDAVVVGAGAGGGIVARAFGRVPA